VVLEAQIGEYLIQRDCPRTWKHSQSVALEALSLAMRFGVDEKRAEQSAWLHDISAVIPVSERLQAALEYGLEVLPEEAAHPMILHQKLSAVLAREVFSIEDEGILQAIGCHTTLRAGYTTLDLVLFVADKLAWDQPGEAPYAAAMRAGLKQGLEQAAWVYMDRLWQRRAELKCVHPWMVTALQALSSTLKR
jgi:predicted HD superfamily hydrolase involved in NAD metabolism